MELNPYSLLPAIPGSGEGKRYNPIPPGTTLDEAWPELKKRMEKLYANPGLDEPGCMADCGYIHSACQIWCKSLQSEIFIKRLINCKVVDLFGQCWQTCLSEELLQRRTDKYYALLELSAAMCALTDTSDTIGYRFLQLKIYRVLFNGLSSEPLMARKMNDPIRSPVAIGHVTVLHNVLKRIDVAKRTYREAENAVEILQTFRFCANLALSTLANLVQSYIITDMENEQVNSSIESFNPIVQTLSESISGQLVTKLKIHLPTIDIIAVINNLANTNDHNTSRLIQAGALPHYVSTMKPQCGTSLQMESAKGIWTYAFSCPQEILYETGCMESLKLLANDDNVSVKRNAEGALWVLSNPIMHDTRTSLVSITNRQERLSSTPNPMISQLTNRQCSRSTSLQIGPIVEEENQHVFISYQWHYKKEAKMIAERLRSEQMNMWIDENNMHGSAMDAMAEAVEKASVIVVLLSQRYKDSMNCRSEAQYAFRLKRRVVPVRVEKGYSPDGWLGMLVGSQIVIDLTDPERIEEQMIKILREIRPDPSTAVSNRIPVKEASVDLNEDVAIWIQRHGLSHLAHWFEGMDGSMLTELATLRKEAPAEFFKSLRVDGISFPDRLRLSIALKKTFQF